jgi:hypothetical protein
MAARLSISIAERRDLNHEPRRFDSPSVAGRHLALRVAIINSIGQANPGPRPITVQASQRISADAVMEQLRPTF